MNLSLVAPINKAGAVERPHNLHKQGTGASTGAKLCHDGDAGKAPIPNFSRLTLRNNVNFRS